MTEQRWQRIVEQVALGDPLKDIDCDEQELFRYCEELRSRILSLSDVDTAFALLHRGSV